MFTLAEGDGPRPGWRPNAPPREATPGFTSKNGRVWLHGGIWHALPFRKYASVNSSFLDAIEAIAFIEKDAFEHATPPQEERP